MSQGRRRAKGMEGLTAAPIYPAAGSAALVATGRVRWQFLVEALTLCLLGGLIGIAVGVGAVWPARRAAALDPIEALRYE